jgi:hypothetical protein
VEYDTHSIVSAALFTAASHNEFVDIIVVDIRFAQLGGDLGSLLLPYFLLSALNALPETDELRRTKLVNRRHDLVQR